MTEFKVQVDSPAHAWEMVNVLEQCKGDRMVSWPALLIKTRISEFFYLLRGEGNNDNVMISALL